MNSSERKLGRRLRREKARAEAKATFMKDKDNLDIIADINNLYIAFNKAKRGVRWKDQIQRYNIRALQNIVDLHNNILNGKFKCSKPHSFTIIERGKERNIMSVGVKERIAQKSLCLNVLIPAFRRILIYDNGASLKKKGVSFAINRLKYHMRHFYRRHGNNGFVLKIDIKSYFANIPHDKVKEMIDKMFTNQKLKNFIFLFIDIFKGDIGLGLGTETSQIMAVAFLNSVDHFIKEVLQIKYYGRYMDDIYLISDDKKKLQNCLKLIEKKLNDLGININTKKTFIIPLKNGVPFLKTRFFYNSNGGIVATPVRQAIVRERRKLKKLKKIYKNGDMTLEQVENSYIAWKGHILHKNARRSVHKIDRLVRYLFGKYFKPKKKPRKNKRRAWFRKKKVTP